MHGQQNIDFLITAYLMFRKYSNFYKLIAAQSSFLRKLSFILLFLKAYYIILFNHCNTQHALSLRTVLQIHVQIHYAEMFSLPTPNELCLSKRIVI